MDDRPTHPDHVDPVIAEAVESIGNRFGSQGLRDLIALAQEQLERAEAALRELSDPQ